MTRVKTISTHTIQCSCCGSYVTVDYKVRHALCECCRVMHNREREERKYLRRKRGRTDKPPTVKIISDPDNENGFRPGAAFLLEEHEANRRLGVYTSGTVIEMQGRQVVICGAPNHKQWEREVQR